MLEQFSTDNAVLQKRVIEPRVALQRMADPEDIARAVLFLLSEEAGYITGTVRLIHKICKAPLLTICQVLDVNGGYS